MAPPSAATARLTSTLSPGSRARQQSWSTRPCSTRPVSFFKEEWTTDEFAEYAKALTVEGQQWGVALDGAGIGDPVQNLLLAVYAYGGRWVWPGMPAPPRRSRSSSTARRLL